jgi:hypothetical protein
VSILVTEATNGSPSALALVFEIKRERTILNYIYSVEKCRRHLALGQNSQGVGDYCFFPAWEAGETADKTWHTVLFSW